MKNFVITGIQMRNKGSQAMFLSLYYGLKSLFENCNVVGFANKYDQPEQYSFNLLPYDDYTRLVFKYRLNSVPLLAPLVTTLASVSRKTDKWNGQIAKMEKALQEADAILDASGYTLGSGWGKGGGRLLLQTIKIAKRYNKPIILMPQSFGPFDWGEEDDAEFLKEVKEELSYCTKIYAREIEGYKCLKSLGLDNVELSADMVIREKAFPKASDIHASYEEEVDYPSPGSIGFIINENVFRIGDPDAVLDLYARILNKLVDDGEKVCILNTSTADIHLVESVLDKVKNRDKVRIISGEYSSPELIDIIGRFKYVVASRYHSVVFAYRSGVPAIILGWASKYIDLAAHFQQQDNVFDIREPGVDRIIERIDQMGAKYAEESQNIKDCLENMQTTSVVQQAVSALEA
ncbi:polysaccharide pyruvyl transferase family protein [Qipengyuania qiaonensis]|uniref:Polysaccharide pyruvyl transferase family protein n=1 Tax=Qipengyuania qiaonensis TaxID=2867240 RepID=A0ABS7J7S5_9SPHN|nr:polysaccharide pyruvyl transferase family protein [Qipengyuania qiaonensis]MBX7483365.1 polysaccharide pyruvyl transferase family protein [Qipengyuania qiaonensis]